MHMKIPGRLGDIHEDIRGVKITPLGFYVDQKTLVFSGLIQLILNER